MATKTAPRPAPKAENAGPSLQERAIDYLRVLCLEAIVASPEPSRITDLTRAVTERLQVSWNDEEVGGLASVIRLTLDSDPRFAQSNRQWDLALRMGRAEGDRKKPVERSIEDFIDLFGAPAEPETIATLTAVQYGRDSAYFLAMIDRIAPTRPQLFVTPDDRIGITRWLLEVQSDLAEDVLFDNFENSADEAVARQLADAARDAKVDDAGPLAHALAAGSEIPVPFKPLAFAVWTRLPDVESLALFNNLLGDDQLSILPGPVVATAAHRGQLVDALLELARNPDRAAEMLAAATPTVEETAAPSIGASDGDIDQIHDFMQREPLRSFRVGELCQEVLETFPGSRSYAPMHTSVQERMRNDPRFQWVGFERFRLAGMIPDEVQLLPEGLTFDEKVYVNEDGEEVDKITRPETWKYGLAQGIHDSRVLDVGDDDSESGPAPKELSRPLLLHHFFAGTSYVPHDQRSFFPQEPDILELTVAAPDGQRLDCWFNHRLGLIFGLRSLYEALDAASQLPSWSGPIFTLKPGSSPEEYRLEYSGELDEGTAVPKERLPQLFGVLRAEAEGEGWPLTTILTRILKDYQDGLTFPEIFTQVNIVRRSRRDAVASALSGQRFFTQNPQKPGYIRYDEKRAEKKGKKRGPRRIEEFEEEEEIEVE